MHRAAVVLPLRGTKRLSCRCLVRSGGYREGAAFLHRGANLSRIPARVMKELRPRLERAMEQMARDIAGDGG